MSQIYPDSYNSRIWIISPCENRNDEWKWCVVDSDGGIELCLTKEKDLAEKIVKFLNGKPEESNKTEELERLTPVEALKMTSSHLSNFDF